MRIKPYHLLIGVLTALLLQPSAFALSEKKLEKYYPASIGDYIRTDTNHDQKEKTFGVSYKKKSDLPFAAANFSTMPALLSYKGFLDMDRAIYLETFPKATLKTNRVISFHKKKRKYRAAKYIYTLPAGAINTDQDIYTATYLWQYKDKLMKLQVSCLYQDWQSLHKSALLFLETMQWEKRL